MTKTLALSPEAMTFLNQFVGSVEVRLVGWPERSSEHPDLPDVQSDFDRLAAYAEHEYGMALAGSPQPPSDPILEAVCLELIERLGLRGVAINPTRARCFMYLYDLLKQLSHRDSMGWLALDLWNRIYPGCHASDIAAARVNALTDLEVR